MGIKDVYSGSAVWVRQHFGALGHDVQQLRASGSYEHRRNAEERQQEVRRTKFPGTAIKQLEKMQSIQNFVVHPNGDKFYGEGSCIDETDDIYSVSRRSTLPQVPRWDSFRVVPVDEVVSGNLKWLENAVKICKVIAYFITFAVVLGGAVIAKSAFLFMTSQIREGKTTPYCVLTSRDKKYVAIISQWERSQWIWSLFFAYLVPEFFAFFRSLRICVFKSFRKPLLLDFILVWLFETLHTVGLALFVFVALPELESVKGAMLTNCVALVPAILALLSRHNKEEKRIAKIVIDVLAVIAQLTGLFIWPIVFTNDTQRNQVKYSQWAIPVSITLISFGWWENYVDRRSPFTLITWLSAVKDRLKKSRYYVYVWISLWKMLVFFSAMIAFVALTTSGSGWDRVPIFKNFLNLQQHPIMVSTLNSSSTVNIARHKDLPFVHSARSGGEVTSGDPGLLSGSSGDLLEPIAASPSAPFLVFLIQVVAALVAYLFGKFACRICIQGFSYAFPINLVIPVTISLLIAACGVKSGNVCFLHRTLPDYLYWGCPSDDLFENFISRDQAWIWLLWLLSQTWITLHIWTPKCERLASTEKLYVTPMYSGFLVDQTMGLNRRRDEEDEVKSEELDIDCETQADDKDVSPCYETISDHTESNYTTVPPMQKALPSATDQITHIYACATMWHETKDEMISMLQSIFRMDEDQSARRNAQRYLQIVDPDYYSFETHIFFDDAFEISDLNDDDSVVNRFVKEMVNVIDEAASKVHQTTIHLKPPKKVPTPYGGKLIWTLPGKTQLITHLKDKMKIRHRKRWSQVMYMYYLLGHKLMERDMDVGRKETVAENTYLLTLDGDIDFQPAAVQLLVDLMKKNRNLGAACGRIHPIGSGPMVWYQKFEYAIGHWLQKATEHMIGCVLCSPGCFSMFRAKALMDDNVMKRYTLKSDEARHYVQYDQGEDRWLCTLLLQRGYRVEYSAASDAYTHCPEGFGEFYNQRRRWVPSTMANILDLLMDANRTIKVNDNISFPYIVYQGMLMAGTVLGPGTIFLMLVGAFVAAFRIDNWTSFYANIVPILVFIVVCFTMKPAFQLLLAQIMSAAYALVMMAVLVGISLQMNEDGIGSPSFIFLIIITGSFFIAAVLHPQEFWCVVPGLIYYLSIPSMYLLLIIYSLINLNIVTWGTREVQTKKTKAEMEAERKEMEERQTKKKKNHVLEFFGASSEDVEGGFVLSCANLFSCLFCTHDKQNDEKVQLMKIADSLDTLNKRLDVIEGTLENIAPAAIPRRRSFNARGSTNSRHGGDSHGLTTVNEKDSDDDDEPTFSGDDESGGSGSQEPKQQRDDLINPYWIEDKDLRRGEVEYLTGPERQFWVDMLEKYLHPIDENKEQQARIVADLKELRNKAVFAFFMFNALFVLIVFLLQLNKDSLYINWPLGVKINVTVIEERGTVHVDKQHLHLEPIGFMFVIFFGTIILIQFLAMIFHRFGTLAHILASTEIAVCSRKVDDLSDEAFIQQNAVEIARAFQRLRGLDGEDDTSESGGSSNDQAVGRRRTIHNLEKSMARKQRVGTLDVAFRKRFFNISAEGAAEGSKRTPILNGMRKLSMRRETMKVLEMRRDSVFGEQSRERMRTLGVRNTLQSNNGRRHRASQPKLHSVFTPSKHIGFNNAAYEHSSEEDEDVASSRQSSIHKSTAASAEENVVNAHM